MALSDDDTPIDSSEIPNEAELMGEIGGYASRRVSSSESRIWFTARRMSHVSRDLFEIEQSHVIALGHCFLNGLCRTAPGE